MNKRKNIVCFSGGKDSTALVLYCLKHLNEFITVFCDTKWEHPLTYAYIELINNKYLNGELVKLYSDKYDGFIDLCLKKKRVPSTMARFCTEQLKVIPMKNYLDFIREDSNLFVYQGIRAGESLHRSKMKKNVYDDNLYRATLKRPLFDWTSEQVFDLHKFHAIEPNPLYKLGMKRVGCMPCIMTTLGEIKNIFSQFTEIKPKLKELEQQLGRTFFPPNYIPERYCTKKAEVLVPIESYINEPPIFTTELEMEFYNSDKNKKIVGYKKMLKMVPTVDDVEKYVQSDPDQLLLVDKEEGESCMSYYSLCE